MEKSLEDISRLLFIVADLGRIKAAVSGNNPSAESRRIKLKRKEISDKNREIKMSSRSSGSNTAPSREGKVARQALRGGDDDCMVAVAVGLIKSVII